jgi:hypothetical protein
MKNIIYFILIMFGAVVYGREPYSMCAEAKGKGSTKAEALAIAIAKMPSGATLSHVGYNGYSYQTKNGTVGNYECILRWKK